MCFDHYIILICIDDQPRTAAVSTDLLGPPRSSFQWDSARLGGDTKRFPFPAFRNRMHVCFSGRWLAASINPVGIDSFGPVIGGRVQLRGQLIEAEIRERHSGDDGTTSGLYVPYDTIEFEFVADVPPECPGSGQYMAEYRNGHRVYVLAGAKQGNPYVELGCLVLREQRNDSDSPTPAIRTFRRIGFARWIGEGFEDKELEKIITLFADSVKLAII